MFPGDGLDKSKDTGVGQETYLSAEKLEKFTTSKQQMSNSGFLSDDKLKSILSFLDEVQTADRLSDIDHVTVSRTAIPPSQKHLIVSDHCISTSMMYERVHNIDTEILD